MRKQLLDFWYQWIIAPLWKMKRRIVLFRDRGRCRYCLDKLTSKTFTVDHVLPSSAGGTNAFANLVACCKYCNKYKGNTYPVTTEMRDTMWKAAYRRHQHRAACERRGQIYASDT
jgi:5-methylcytosine-specific restriction endonuclease McrA